MRRRKQTSSFLNAILTTNAVLLAALLWSNIAGQPATGFAFAAPQNVGQNVGQNEGGVPNAGLQRLDMLNELRAIRGELQKLESVVSGGRMRVSVANFDELKIELDYVKLREAFKGGASAPAAASGTVAPATVNAPAAPATTPTSAITPATVPQNP